MGYGSWAIGKGQEAIDEGDGQYRLLHYVENGPPHPALSPLGGGEG
jgi:hypothetical protein